jgi:Family of unknown function (DUF6518)
MAYVIAVVVGLVFGAGDQYLGTIRFDPWLWTVSGMSAPWLVLPFLVGRTQDRARRAAVLALAATAAALVGYFAMTYSPMESVPASEFLHGFVAIATSGYNPLWIAGGLLFGPVLGYLGHRWRVARSWVGPAAVVCALCFEPLAWKIVGRLEPQPFVWGTEVAVGLAAAVAFSVALVMGRRARAA